MSEDAKVNLVQSFTEEYTLQVVSPEGELLAAVPLGTNSKKEAAQKADRIIACVVVAGGFTDQT